MSIDDLLGNNPLYHVFYGTLDIAYAAAFGLFIALIVALWQNRKLVSVGIGVGMLLALTAAITLTVNHVMINDAFAYFDAHPTADYVSPHGMTFLGTPILMATAAVALLVLVGKIAWAKGRTSTKLLLISVYLLGASLAGTFATSLMVDCYSVGTTPYTTWENTDAYMWAAVFVTSVAVVVMLLACAYVHRSRVMHRFGAVTKSTGEFHTRTHEATTIGPDATQFQTT